MSSKLMYQICEMAKEPSKAQARFLSIFCPKKRIRLLTFNLDDALAGCTVSNFILINTHYSFWRVSLAHEIGHIMVPIKSCISAKSEFLAHEWAIKRAIYLKQYRLKKDLITHMRKWTKRYGFSQRYIRAREMAIKKHLI